MRIGYRQGATFLALVGLYLAGNAYAVHLANGPGDFALFWPSAGIAFAAVLRYGLRWALFIPVAMVIDWFLRSNPKEILQVGRWGAVGLFALLIPLLIGLAVHGRWLEAIALSAVMLVAFVFYGPRILGQFRRRRRLVPGGSRPAAYCEYADAPPAETEMVQRSIAVLEDFLYTDPDRRLNVGVLASLSFDASLDTLLALCCGHRIELIPADVRRDATEAARESVGVPRHFVGCDRACGSPPVGEVLVATADGYRLRQP